MWYLCNEILAKLVMNELLYHLQPDTVHHPFLEDYNMIWVDSYGRCTSVTYIIHRIFVGVPNSDSFMRPYDAHLEFIVFTYNVYAGIYLYLYR